MPEKLQGGFRMTGLTLFLVVVGAAYVASWLLRIVDIIEGKHRR